MKDERKNKILTQMIREALDKMLFLSEDDDEPGGDPQLSWLQGQGAQEIEDREPGSYYDDSEMHKPWDNRVKELSSLLSGIALDVIDHYKGKPSFTKEAAKKEILEAVGVPLDVFLGDQPEFGEFYSLDQILEEEFEGINEETINVDDQKEEEKGNASSNEGGMDELNENNTPNREND